MMNQSQSVSVKGEITKNGLAINFRNQRYTLEYPEEVWGNVPPAWKVFFLDNLTFAGTMHLPMADVRIKTMLYDTNRPYLEPYFFQNFLMDIPSCCDMDQEDVSRESIRFLQIRNQFESKNIACPTEWKTESQTNRAIIPMSFGKDSLLTFALSEELGLDPVPIFVHEPSFSQERIHKVRLGKAFEQKFGKVLNILEHDLGLLRDDGHLELPKNEYGWGLQSTEYALMMLPYARYHHAKYIFFGNEQSAASSYNTSNGWEVFPCFDQTHRWTVQISSMTQICSQPAPISTGSLIEPLMDMMIQRILVRRYPEYAHLQMSCFAEGEEGKDYHWCHNCSICTKMYLLCVGGNVNPAQIGFRHSMLTMNEIQYFPLLGGSSEFPYARTKLARDEQLFALFCAVQFGSKEPIVLFFQKSDLFQEALERRRELLQIFVQQYPSISIPSELQSSLNTIYTEEIQSFISELGEQ